MSTTDPLIFYIEDERPVLELVRQALKLSGYNVEGATSGRQGLEMIRQKKPSLVLLDLMMPDFNGWDVYQAMKNDDDLADVPVIVVTATIPERNRVIVEGLPPVEDYITKPFDMEQLIRAIQKVL